LGKKQKRKRVKCAKKHKNWTSIINFYLFV
jgi:hypothetical protein